MRLGVGWEVLLVIFVAWLKVRLIYSELTEGK